MLAGVQMHHALFVAFTIVAAVPVLGLASWVEHRAVQQEVDAARDKHLLVARNLTAAFSRYVFDLKAGFELAVSTGFSGQKVDGLNKLLSSLEFRHICIVDETGQVENYMAGLQESGGGQIRPEALDAMRAQLKGDSDIVISDLTRDKNGNPAFMMLRGLAGGKFAFGVVATDYLVRQQKAIAFGARGHAVVLDAKGKVVGHPFQDWIDKEFDLSKIPPARAMSNGDTGVMQFYSPAYKADMITAYTTVPETGWGIMVPQPMQELYDAAAGVKTAANYISFGGLVVAGFISWLLARVIAGPIQQISAAAKAIREGELSARAPQLPIYVASEARELADAFNSMVDDLSGKSIELSNAVVRAEAANRAKSEFLANMSHELRTPLNAIQGFSEVMRDGIFGPIANVRYQGYLGDIHSSASHLIKVISEILDLSKAEAGMLVADKSAVSLPSVFELALRLVEQRAVDRHLDLSVKVDPSLSSELIQTDEGKLTQILLNLLSNAVKFTEPGGSVTLTALHAGDMVEVTVSDTGIGIRPADIEKVLTPFGQVSSAFHAHEGTGLGLPLSKKLAEALGGSLEVQSEIGVGTTVTVWIPMVDAMELAAAA